MGSTTTDPPLQGRRHERALLDGLLTAVREGHSAAWVLRGEAGIGKTALLEYLVRSATGCRVLQASGVESEMELPFAGLQQLCGPLLEGLEELPHPQYEALGTAFGLINGESPDRFLVGLAVLTLLSTAAATTPVVCVVDDAQWLDRVSAQTLAFVARRLGAESVVMIFGAREPLSTQHLVGIEDIVLEGMTDEEAHGLLASVMSAPLDRQVRDRIVDEARGNPLALLELPYGRSPAELAFGSTRPDLMPMATRIERDYQRRLEPLPPHTRQLLLTAAVEPVGDPSLLWRAADVLGISVDTTPAKAAGLLQPGEGLRFRHPLVRSAVYRLATPSERSEAHRALAQVSDAIADPDRRAWHLAQACVGPDETVAAELEIAAERAHRRGGVAAAAALLERAAALTPDAHKRGARAVAAAEAEYAAAAPQTAAELVAMARLCPLGELLQARLARLEAQILFARTRGGEAARMLTEAAGRLEAEDPVLARETYLEAISAAIVGARLDGPHGVRAVAAAARAGPSAVVPHSPSDMLLDGVAAWLTEGDAAFPAMRDALSTYLQAPLHTRRETMTWLFTYFAALQVCNHQLWELDTWHALASRAVQLCRDLGALSVLPIALMSLAGAKLHAGDLRGATSLIEEGNAITAATRYAAIKYTALNLVAWQGKEQETEQMLAQVVPDATDRGEIYVLGLANYVRAILYNGLGRFDLAREGASRVAAYDGFSFRGWALAELIEAAVRTGDLEEAATACDALAGRTRLSGSDWALGIQHRCDALLVEGEEAERLYALSIERLERSRVAPHEARARLLYGEWLRRQGRRTEARNQLDKANDMCTTMGMDAFAARASRELRTTGGSARRRTAEPHQGLTAQETQIAQLAASGKSNPEIAAHLFLSPHTVEWHLRKVFTKLGIHSRRDLAAVLPEG